MKRRNKWSRTGSERGTSMDQMIEKLGGSGGGARRVSKKAKTNVSKTGKADSGASGVEETLYGDWNIGGKTGIVKGKAKPKKSVKNKKTKREKEKIAKDKVKASGNELRGYYEQEGILPWSGKYKPKGGWG